MKEQLWQSLLNQTGVPPEQSELLKRALTHPSCLYDSNHQGQEHNQRLEFLGDAVLGLVVGEYLYSQFPQKPEGELTKMRAAVVCEANLAQAARKLSLGSLLLLGRGEEASGGRDRTSILADALEAVIGAAYLTAGLEAARSFILNLLQEDIGRVAKGAYGDHKTQLQELIQRRGDQSIKYRILEETGPDHDKRFVAGVLLAGELAATGMGRTKKEAEQQAAAQALEKLRKGDGWT